MTRPQILMCAPAHFDVRYEINPWMHGNLGQVDAVLAREQWTALHTALLRCAEVGLVQPQPGLPDMVFTANAGLVFGRIFVPSNFAHVERQGEHAHFAHWFAEAGYAVSEMPHTIDFEGAGDALFSADDPVLWLGHGFRTDPRAAGWLAEQFELDVVPLHLIDPHYYHLDTCFCPLDGGGLLWNPAAFDADSRAQVEARIPVAQRIAVDAGDAASFACNAVSLGKLMLMNHASPALVQALRATGREPVFTPLGEFMKSGGAAKCLTLRLDAEALPWAAQEQPTALAA